MQNWKSVELNMSQNGESQRKKPFSLWPLSEEWHLREAHVEKITLAKSSLSNLCLALRLLRMKIWVVELMRNYSMIWWRRVWEAQISCNVMKTRFLELSRVSLPHLSMLMQGVTDRSTCLSVSLSAEFVAVFLSFCRIVFALRHLINWVGECPCVCVCVCRMSLLWPSTVISCLSVHYVLSFVLKHDHKPTNVTLERNETT